MTDPTPTPQTPPQGLTEAALREQWNAQADEFNQWESLDPDEQFAWAQKCAIAADRAARVGLHCYLDDDGPCPSPCVFDDPADQISNCTYAQGLQRDSKPKTACPYYRTTPTTTPPQGLTDERLLELATATSNYEMCGVLAIDRANHYGVNGSELIAFARAAIAAHEAQRMEWLKGSREIAILTAAIDGRIAAHEAARPHLTPEEVEARFRAWWGECYPNVPAGGHTVRSHVAFAMHLTGGEVAA